LSLFQNRHALIAGNARGAVKPAAEYAEKSTMEMELQNSAAVSPMGNTWHGRKGGQREGMKTPPVIDITECSGCETCIELCPAVFVRNKETGFIEIKELEEYPKEEIHMAVQWCPRECIALPEDA
jgi:ferredoxin